MWGWLPNHDADRDSVTNRHNATNHHRGAEHHRSTNHHDNVPDDTYEGQCGS